MAGYSGTPLAIKLGIRPGHAVALVAAPDGFEAALDGLPDGVAITRWPAGAAPPDGPFDVLVAFTRAAQALEAGFETWAGALRIEGGLWIAWPKRASGVPTDLDENRVRAVGLAAGRVDNKVCAVDDVWSGLRFVVRRADRPRR